ncbi:MAG: 4-hydroxy-tetrahydrodipicolinate synthase [Clostridia bacterium]|nr:4-hydroxy-tetrahydrodipicolinate synthase [Clostridia bacterium]
MFTGTGTALVTPFRNDEIDWESLEMLIEDQLAGGVRALIAAGTTGEPSTMTWEEHLKVIRFVTDKAKGRACIIAGTGSNCTKEVIEAAKELKDYGADAQLCVTPYYNKTTQDGLVAHYNAIADSDTMPVIVYNVPGRTGMNILPSTLQRITAHENVVAVKEANDNFVQAMEKIRLCGHQADFYSGMDEVIVPLMNLGYKGVISVVSNVMPRQTSEMTELALQGKWEEANALQLKYLPFIQSLFWETNPTPAKAALALMGKMSDEVRLPLVPMSEANRSKMAVLMKELGLL